MRWLEMHHVAFDAAGGAEAQTFFPCQSPFKKIHVLNTAR